VVDKPSEEKASGHKLCVTDPSNEGSIYRSRESETLQLTTEYCTFCSSRCIIRVLSLNEGFSLRLTRAPCGCALHGVGTWRECSTVSSGKRPRRRPRNGRKESNPSSEMGQTRPPSSESVQPDFCVLPHPTIFG
jgi:hypothetical protein